MYIVQNKTLKLRSGDHKDKNVEIIDNVIAPGRRLSTHTTPQHGVHGLCNTKIYRDQDIRDSSAI